MVMLWSIGSKVNYWKGSHKHWLDPVEADNDLLRVARARLRQLGLEPTPEDFEEGGL